VSRKLFFEDGSTIEVVVTSQNGGKAAAAAYQRLLEFIDDELMDEFDVSLQADDLDSLEVDKDVDLDEADFDEIDLDEDEVDDLDDLDDQLMDDDDEDDAWGDDDDHFSFR
jgi:hypothetical protein